MTNFLNLSQNTIWSATVNLTQCLSIQKNEQQAVRKIVPNFLEDLGVWFWGGGAGGVARALHVCATKDSFGDPGDQTQTPGSAVDIFGIFNRFISSEWSVLPWIVLTSTD